MIRVQRWRSGEVLEGELTCFLEPNLQRNNSGILLLSSCPQGAPLSLSLPPSYSSFFSFSGIIHLLLLHPLTRLSFPQFAEKLDFSRINIPENSDSVQKQIKLFTLGRIISINNHLQM